MSKTIGNIISIDDLVNRYGPDASRYLLATEFTYGSDGDVSLKSFDKRYNSELADNLGNLVNRTITMIKKYGIETKNEASSLKIDISSDIENLKFKEAVEKVIKELTYANQKIENAKPWELFENKEISKIKDLFYNPKDGIVPVILAAADALEPIMPNKSKEIKKQLKNLKPNILFEKV